MIIVVLAVKNFFEQKLDRMFEFPLGLLEILGTQKMLEFRQYVFVFPWIELNIILAFKVLNLEEQHLEYISAWNFINIYCQNGLQGFIALGIFAHGAVMNRISLVNILLGKDLAVSVDNVLGILLKKISNSHVEISESFHSFCIMENSGCKFTMLDVHILESVSIFLAQKLIEQGLFQINSFDVEDSNHAFEIASETHIVVSVSVLVIDIDLLVDNILRSTHFLNKIQCDILESQKAIKINC